MHSIEQSGGAKLLDWSIGANEYYEHLLPHDSEGNAKPVHEAHGSFKAEAHSSEHLTNGDSASGKTHRRVQHTDEEAV